MPKANQPVTYDHLKSKKKPVMRSVWISFDSELSEEVDELERKLAVLRPRAARSKDDESIQQELADTEAKFLSMRDELRKSSQKFVFRSLSRRKYDELLTRHQPTDEQQAEAKKMGGADAVLEFNPETFPEALVAACIMEPELTSEDVHDIFTSDDWNGSETLALFNTALSACINRGSVNLGNG